MRRLGLQNGEREPLDLGAPISSLDGQRVVLEEKDPSRGRGERGPRKPRAPNRPGGLGDQGHTLGATDPRGPGPPRGARVPDPAPRAALRDPAPRAALLPGGGGQGRETENTLCSREASIPVSRGTVLGASWTGGVRRPVPRSLCVAYRALPRGAASSATSALRPWGPGSRGPALPLPAPSECCLLVPWGEPPEAQ